MRIIKILIFWLLITIGLVFDGELNILYLDSFQNEYYQSTFSIDTPKNDAENVKAIDAFLNTGKITNVDFFCIDRQLKSDSDITIVIYGTPDAIKVLKRNGIMEGENNSMFFGNSDVQYMPFKMIDDVSKVSILYYIGNSLQKKNFDNFKAKLINEYGGGFPKLLGNDKETYMNLIGVWGTIISLLLIISLYCALYQRKEIAVRILLGEDIRRIILKNIVTDNFLYILLFIISAKLLSLFSNSYFKIEFVVITFFVFLLANIFMELLVMKIDFKRDIASANNGNNLLTFSYVLKIISTAVAVTILCSNYYLIDSTYNLYQQREFFHSVATYNYVHLSYRPDNKMGKNDSDDAYANQKFFEKYQEDSLQYIDLTGNFNSTYPVLLMNKNALVTTEDGRKLLNEINKTTTPEKMIYIILPSNISRHSEEYDTASEICRIFFSETGRIAPEALEYNEKLAFVGVHRSEKYQMKLYTDPIIIFYNINFKVSTQLYGYDLYYACDTMYRISEDDFNDFANKYEFTDQINTRTNVLDVYKNALKEALRNLQFILILSFLVLILEISLIFLVVDMNFRINAMEIALKKTYGYSLVKRNFSIYKITLWGSIAGIIISFGISVMLKLSIGLPLIAIGGVTCIIEMLIVSYKVIKSEKYNVALVLKGERI